MPLHIFADQKTSQGRMLWERPGERMPGHQKAMHKQNLKNCRCLVPLAIPGLSVRCSLCCGCCGCRICVCVSVLSGRLLGAAASYYIDAAGGILATFLHSANVEGASSRRLATFSSQSFGVYVAWVKHCNGIPAYMAAQVA